MAVSKDDIKTAYPLPVYNYKVEIGGDSVQGIGARVAEIQGDVFDKLSDRASPVGGPIGRLVCGPDRTIETRTGERHRSTDEGRGCGAHRLEKTGSAHQPNQCWSWRACRLMDRRVHQHDPRDVVAMAFRPAEGDRAAPVLSNGDHGPGQVESVGQGTQVVNTPVEAAHRAGALGIPHVELIHGDHANSWWSLGDQISPKIRPGRVAVDTEQRMGRIRDSVVEDVPRAAGYVEFWCFNKPRPPRIEAGEFAGWQDGGCNRASCHQRSSITAVLMPEPMPISNT